MSQTALMMHHLAQLPALGSAFPASPAFGNSLLALSQSAAATFVNAVWQGAIIAASLAICLKLAPRTSAALRFALWIAAFVLVCALPFVPAAEASLVTRTNSGAYSGKFGIQAASTTHPWLQLDIRWSILISALWLAASFYRAADLAMHTFRLRKLWKSAKPVDPSPAANPARFLQRRPVELCTTADLDRPAVIGFLAPRILIPEWLMAQLTPEELTQIVLHESEHLRRGDDWTNLIQKLSLVLFPLNPVLIWMERRLCLEREIACDDGVVQVTNAPRAYASCLTSLAERGLHHRTEALSLGVLRRRPELVQRVHSLLRRGQVLSPAASRALAAALTCAMAVGVVELSRSPQLVSFVASPTVTGASTTPDALNTSPRFGSQAIDSRLASPFLASPFKVVRARATAPARVEPLFLKTDSRGNLVKPARAIPVAAARPQAINQAINPVANRAVMTAFTGASAQTVPELPRAGSPRPADQGWIVMTTWEQESIPSPGIGPANQQLSRTTVTQLVFRVLPAKQSGPNSVLSSPDAMPALVSSPDGWLVIQL